MDWPPMVLFGVLLAVTGLDLLDKNKEENKMKYNTLRIIRQLLKNELEGMEREMTVLNNDLKKLDPDGLLPETDPRVKMRKTASDWRYELECALKDFDAQDWQ